jgi:hypothetical protein
VNPKSGFAFHGSVLTHHHVHIAAAHVLHLGAEFTAFAVEKG